jgi:hypothetical protein
MIEFLRGKANQGAGQHCGRLEIDIQNWGLFLPANSTLRSHVPPALPYQGIVLFLSHSSNQAGITESTVKLLKEAMERKGTKPIGIIINDEIEIRGGLCYMKYLGLVVGLFSIKMSKKYPSI